MHLECSTLAMLSEFRWSKNETKKFRTEFWLAKLLK